MQAQVASRLTEVRHRLCALKPPKQRAKAWQRAIVTRTRHLEDLKASFVAAAEATRQARLRQEECAANIEAEESAISSLRMLLADVQQEIARHEADEDMGGATPKSPISLLRAAVMAAASDPDAITADLAAPFAALA